MTKARAIAALTLCTALSTVAGALPATDPVFKPGQVWQMTFQSGGQTVTRTLTVGKLLGTQRGMYFYGRDSSTPSLVTVEQFKYDPVDDDPEFIELSYAFAEVPRMKSVHVREQDVTQEDCFVRLSQSRVQGTLNGALARSKGTDLNRTDMTALSKYVNTGQLSGLPQCWVKRLK